MVNMALLLNRRQWFQKASWLASAGLAYGCNPIVIHRSYPLPQSAADKTSLIRLDSNENPYSPSKTVRHSLIGALDEIARYPWRYYRKLRELIADREGLSPDQVLLGAGSEELLRMAAMVCALENGEVVTAHPSYEAFERYASASGAKVHRVPLGPDFRLDLEAMDKATTGCVRLVYICNPNNPTSTLLSADRLEPFCKEMVNKAIVLVDEAYHEYVEAPEYRSMINLVKDEHQVIVTRTFSKIYGLAGLRIGYAISRPDIIARLRTLRTDQSANVLGLLAAFESYKDNAFLQFCRSKNTEVKKYLEGELKELGFCYLPSHSNFIFFKTDWDIRQFRHELIELGVVVGRPFRPYFNWCRVSIGTIEEIKKFVLALRKVIASRLFSRNCYEKNTFDKIIFE